MILGKRIGVISLGCDKNRVDTEKMLFRLQERHTLVSDPEQAQIVIINTCAFLQSSRSEAIEEVLAVALVVVLLALRVVVAFLGACFFMASGLAITTVPEGIIAPFSPILFDLGRFFFLLGAEVT
jgi:hypothetical protein